MRATRACRLARRLDFRLKSSYPAILANQWWKGSGSVSVLNKYTQEEAFTVAAADRATVASAFEAAEKALPAMAKLASYQRRDALMAAADHVEQNREEFVFASCVEVGKARADAEGEVSRTVNTLRLSGEEAVRMKGFGGGGPLDEMAGLEGLSYSEQRFPLGVVSAISAFNFSMNLSAHKVGPAIAVGCPIVLKPSEQSPLGSLLLGRALLSSGILPEGSLSVLPTVEGAAPEFSENKRPMVLSFTGSPKVGWQLWREQAGREGRKVLLELGGVAHCLVDDSINTEQLSHIADRIVWAAFAVSGQSCISVQRVLVAPRHYEGLLQLLAQRVEALAGAVGDPLEEATRMGPLISVEAAQRVHQWTAEAVQAGARLVVGGTPPQGSVLAPSLLTQVASGAKLSCEEVFGPVLVVEARDWSASLQEVRNSPYGLQAGVFSSSWGRIHQAYTELEVGALVVGDVPTVRADSAPYGGVRLSGVGREGIRSAMLEYTEPRVMLVKEAAKWQ